MVFQAPLRNRHNGRNVKSLYNVRRLFVGKRLKSEAILAQGASLEQLALWLHLGWGENLDDLLGAEDPQLG